ncbi:hypothetical protein D3I12_14410 [Enterococcus faecalis]|nr:hypothetical protein [Enterococcus faecalis]
MWRIKKEEITKLFEETKGEFELDEILDALNIECTDGHRIQLASYLQRHFPVVRGYREYDHRVITTYKLKPKQEEGFDEEINQ